MAGTETVVTVEKVDGPNSNGWYDVTFEDGRKAATKNEEVAKHAFQSRGTSVTAVISEVVNGKFTNIYLNEIDGVKDGFKPRGGSKASGGSAKAGRTPAENERIARQWAYGRAVELMIGSGAEFAFPLDSAAMSQLAEQAELLLNATKDK